MYAVYVKVFIHFLYTSYNIQSVFYAQDSMFSCFLSV